MFLNKKIYRKLEKMSIADILSTYTFPHRFYAYFASQCAKDACQRADHKHPDSLKAIDLAERFGLGESFTESELKAVTSAASNAAYAAYAANAASNAASTSRDYYKPLLLECLKTQLTEIERLVILGE